jgi:hypothetical protein
VRCRGLHATVASGNGWWKFAVLWIRFSLIRKPSMHLATAMIACCWV